MGSNPIFPNITKICQYSYISNHYNLLVSKKHCSKTVKLTQTTLKLVRILFSNGVISNFVTFINSSNNKKFIKFTVFFYKNSPFFKKIKTISTQSKTFYISKNSLILLKKIFKSSLLILSTTNGLLTSKAAAEIGIGGKIIYIIT